jgi:hypothetical protein
MTDPFMTVAGALALLGCLVFLVRYPTRTRGAWKRHPWGRHVMMFVAITAALFVQSLAFRVLGDWPGRELLLKLSFSAFVVVIWHRVFLNETDLQPRKVVPMTRPLSDSQLTPDPAPAPSSLRRPRPVLIYAAIVAGLQAFLGVAGLTDLMPSRTVAIVSLVSVVVSAMGAALLQGVVTPLSAPQDGRGRPLLPEWTATAPVRSAARAGAMEGGAHAAAAAAVEAVGQQELPLLPTAGQWSPPSPPLPGRRTA